MAGKTGTRAKQHGMENELRQVGKKLDALAVRARSAQSEVRASSLAQIRRLRVKQAQAKTALAKLGRQSAAASGPLKQGVRRAWRDIEVAVKRATQRFRQTG